MVDYDKEVRSGCPLCFSNKVLAMVGYRIQVERMMNWLHPSTFYGLETPALFWPAAKIRAS